MHSSRMRTGRALTVSGGGGVHIPEGIFGRKEIEKKRKKNLETPARPPPKFQTTPVDRQTPVNLLPWHNFVAAGKNSSSFSCNANEV